MEKSFYSPLKRAIQCSPAALEDKPAATWASWIQSNAAARGVKQDELEWSGINEFLMDAGKSKLSRQCLIDQIDRQGVDVEMVILGQKLQDPKLMYEGLANDCYGSSYEDLSDRAQKDVRYMAERRAKDGGVVDETQYGKWTLPGGKNYREVLLKLVERREPVRYVARERFEPTQSRPFATYNEGAVANKLNHDRTFATMEEAVAHAQAMNAKGISRSKSPSFKSPHWDGHEGVLAHLRLKDHYATCGSKVLLVEEIQSDWGQKGKKSGFTASPKERAEIDAISREVDAAGGFGKACAELQARSKAAGLRLVSGAVPAAPFVTKTESWLGLSLKHVLVLAVDEGYDAVAFVTGEQSCERFDLSKHIDVLSYQPPVNKGEPGWLQAWDKEDKQIMDLDVLPDGLDDHVGKELARRLLATTTVNGHHMISGQDVRVGGDGMKVFYDQIVPQAMSKLLARVGGSPMSSLSLLGSDAESGQPSFMVCDAVRASVSSGLPLF